VTCCRKREVVTVYPAVRYWRVARPNANSRCSGHCTALDFEVQNDRADRLGRTLFGASEPQFPGSGEVGRSRSQGRACEENTEVAAVWPALEIHSYDNAFYKRKSQEKNIPHRRNFSCFPAPSTEQDVF
jgi:hypothetical protein